LQSRTEAAQSRASEQESPTGAQKGILALRAVESFRRKTLRNRAIFSSRAARENVWRAVLAVEPVMCEPVSTSQFPGNRENISEFRQNRPCSRSFGFKISTELRDLGPCRAQAEQGISLPDQGCLIAEQGSPARHEPRLRCDSSTAAVTTSGPRIGSAWSRGGAVRGLAAHRAAQRSLAALGKIAAGPA
jgi:hypothetical protein